MKQIIRSPGSGRVPHHRLLLCWCVCVVFALWPGRAQAQNRPGPYAPADIAYGSQIYMAQCSACHGVNGDAVSGLNFRSQQFRRVSSDADLRTIVTGGIAGTAMPAFTFDAAELAGIIAYLRSMDAFDATTLGDPARGLTLFEGSGRCANCHRVSGKGPRVAPDLSNIGAIRTPDLLERTVLDPDASMLPANRSVRAVTREGKVVTGRRLNEDTYTIQIIDQQEQLISFVKADLREYTFLKASGMPPYKDKLTSKDVADLVAYLLSLKGAP